MSKTSEIKIKVFYKEDGIDGKDILRDSIMLWIEKEVKALCQKNS